jgi:hypothetical protein
MRGTGRYNIAQGVVATVQGVGASSSGLVARLIVDNFCYTAAFGEAAVAAAIALAVLVILMPETATPEPNTPSTEDQTCPELAQERSGQGQGLGATQGPDKICYQCARRSWRGPAGERPVGGKAVASSPLASVAWSPVTTY